MKPLRTGLGVGLLTGAAGAAVKLYQNRKAGTLGTGAAAPRVVTGTTATRVGPAATKAIGPGGTKGVKGLVDAAVDGKDSLRARRAARRAVANRPAWVVAPTPDVAAGVVRPTTPTRLTPTVPRKVPNLVPKTPVSAKTVGASVGKYAVKRFGKVIGQVAADRMGKAIEIIEVLEQVVASVSEPATKADIPITGPGATMSSPPAVVALAPNPARPGGDGPATPKGTLVSVRKFERGPRVVVGPGVAPPPAGEPDLGPEPTTPAADLTVGAAVEAIADAVEAAVEAASVDTSAAPSDAGPAEAADTTTRTARKARSTTAEATPKPSKAPSKAPPKAQPKAPAAKKAAPRGGPSATPARKPRAAKRSTAGDRSSTNGDTPTATAGDEAP